MKKILFLLMLSFLLLIQCTTNNRNEEIIMTVNGPVPATGMGTTLIHEHVLVDFIGADSIHNGRWNSEEVYKVVLPYLQELKALGCQTLIECTPSYLGKDPLLLKKLSDVTGMYLLTNTGFYGAGNNKYIPRFAFTETADELAGRWIAEWENGIEGTGIKPGFIKIGVDGGHLSDMHRKLIQAAAKAHLQTGLVIVSHTGPSVPAFEQMEIMQEEGVSPEAFVWTHAQAASGEDHIKAARMGAWISLDGLGDDNVMEYAGMIQNLKQQGLLHKVLLSHDAGWYDPAKEGGGNFRGFNTLFIKLIPALYEAGFTKEEVNQLLVVNPSLAFKISVRNN